MSVQHLARRTRFTHHFSPEATSDVISSRFVGTVIPDNRGKFGNPCINLSREIPPEVILDGIFDSFFRCSFRREVASDVLSRMADQDVDVDVCANFDDCRLKPSVASFSASYRTSITSDRYGSRPNGCQGSCKIW